MTLGLSIIVKNEVESLQKLHDSFCENLFDQKVSIFTGTNPETRNLLLNLGFEVYDMKWEDDFSLARNLALSKMKTDWIMWVDADDVIENSDKIRSTLSTDSNAIYCEYLYDKNFPIFRERIVRNDTHKWSGSIHESLSPIVSEIRYDANDFRVIHDHELNREDRLSRNLRISEKAYKAKESFQAVYYYAMSLYDYKRYSECIPIFEEYLTHKIHDQYRYYAMIWLAYANHFLGNKNSCFSWCDKCLQLAPLIAEPIFIKAISETKSENWEEVIRMCERGFHLHKPVNWILPVNSRIYDAIPVTLYKNALSKFTEAVYG